MQNLFHRLLLIPFILFFSCDNSSNPTAPEEPPEPSTVQVVSMTIGGLSSNFDEEESEKQIFINNLASSLGRAINPSRIHIISITPDETNFIIDIYIDESTDASLANELLFEQLTGDNFTIPGCDFLGVSMTVVIPDCAGVPYGENVQQTCGCGPPGTLGIPNGACNCNGDEYDECNICGGNSTSCSRIYEFQNAQYYYDVDCQDHMTTTYAGQYYNAIGFLFEDFEDNCNECGCNEYHQMDIKRNAYLILNQDTFMQVEYDCMNTDWTMATHLSGIDVDGGCGYYEHQAIDSCVLLTREGSFSSEDDFLIYSYETFVQNESSGTIFYSLFSDDGTLLLDGEDSYEGCIEDSGTCNDTVYDYYCREEVYTQYDFYDEAGCEMGNDDCVLDVRQNFDHEEGTGCVIINYKQVESYEMGGCTDPSNINYNLGATFDDGSCDCVDDGD